MKKGPNYHTTHRKEDRSKAGFERLVDPCIVNWFQKDYGIDCMVTLFNNAENDSVELDSIYFHVQLKGTTTIAKEKNNFSFAVETNKIRDWSKSNVCLLLVVTNLNSGKFYGKWINGELINSLSKTNPDWITKQKVTLKFGEEDRISKGSIETFREYLLSKRANQISILPGQYFYLRDQVKLLLDQFQKISTPFGFISTEKNLEVLFKKLDLAIYRIAIAGPSRAGKSTLINALLKKDISPVGIYQTTGVPIQIIPGPKNQLTVYQKDGTNFTKDFSGELITRYASQNENYDNYKKVKFVSVEIVNAELEKGISFFDVPGLDDPDDEILQHTSSYVKTFNAIIYLIDVTPHATGGFALKGEFKRQIKDMSSSLDKVFLVFNKVDFLSEDQLISLKSRIDYDLKRLDLLDKIDEKIHFVSAKMSFEQRKKDLKNLDDSVSVLEKNIWEYLLRGNKAGVYRLLDVIKEIHQSFNDFTYLLNTRLLNSDSLDRLFDAIDQTTKKLPELGHIFTSKHADIKDKIKLLLDAQKGDLLTNLKNQLKEIPQTKSLPKDSEIKSFLLDQINVIIDKGNQTCHIQVNIFKTDIDLWIESNLENLREIIDSNHSERTIDVSPIETMKIPAVDLSSAWGMGLLGGIIGFMVNPYAAAAVAGGALVGYFGLLFVTAETRRAMRINRIVDSAKSNCDVVFDDLKNKFDEGIDEILLSVTSYAQQKITLYFTDLNNQIQQINTGQLSAEDKKIYNECFNQLEELRELLNKTSSEIIMYK